jgi:hypothetical protein
MDRLLLVVTEAGDNDQAEAEGEEDDAKNDINVACLRWKRFILYLVVFLNGTTLPVLLLICDMLLRCWGANNSKDSAVEDEDKKTGDLRVLLVMIVLAVALATVTNIRLLWILTEYWKWIL